MHIVADKNHMSGFAGAQNIHHSLKLRIPNRNKNHIVTPQQQTNR